MQSLMPIVCSVLQLNTNQLPMPVPTDQVPDKKQKARLDVQLKVGGLLQQRSALFTGHLKISTFDSSICIRTSLPKSFCKTDVAPAIPPAAVSIPKTSVMSFFHRCRSSLSVFTRQNWFYWGEGTSSYFV